MADIIQAVNSHDELVALVKALQWGGPGSGVCPECGGFGPDVDYPVKHKDGSFGTARFEDWAYGHREDCPIAAALATAEIRRQLWE